MVRYMSRCEEKENDNEFPSLYDSFELGDRVKRTYKDDKGIYRVYKGIVLAINENGIEIYWDTQNGKYRPDGMNLAFSNCELKEIFKGNNFYSPIEKE